MKNFARKWGLLGVLLALMGAVYFSDLGKSLSLANLAANQAILQAFVGAHFWQALLIFVVLYMLSTALSVPGGAVLTITGGFLFGWWLGGLLAIFAATSGAVILFLIAKSALGETLRQKAQGAIKDSIEKLRAGFNENAFSYLLFLRLVPLFPFWLVNLVPALLQVRLSVYIAGTFIGIIPGTFAFAFLGSGLESVLAQQQKIYQACLNATPQGDCQAAPSVAQLITTELILALCFLGAVALIPIFIQKRQQRRGQSKIDS